ncbi:MULTISPECIES: FeoA family protein [Cyanophyceae]|uniref:FeoA family protein n=1 Tax=Pseudocalidococcus azoricus BACA0444 TaxID=2918990 RepID=A0AAE4JXP4_9CYAN|nr:MULTISPECIES: FeoA family protein [Cyanophyceae]AFY60766.1 Fe2+ transport system protein A [Synechococcus sp. PCC 6312]MDS3862496.1 FeoA family protein [Pseudocalidococcus azoricus BACA0444]
MPLSELPIGEIATISHTEATVFGPGFTDRLAALGIMHGRKVEVLRKAALGGPLHIRVGLTTEVAIRRHEAALIILNAPSVPR